MDTAVLFGGSAETFCGIIIDALKDLRLRGELVTPDRLNQELFKKEGYIELLDSLGIAGSASKRSILSEKENLASESFHDGSEPLENSYIKRLQDFYEKLFGEFKDKLPEELLTRASEILEIIRVSNGVEQIMDLNDDVLEVLRAANRKSNGELEKFAGLVKEIGKGLIEMEAGLASSFSCTYEAFNNDKASNNELAQNLGEISETVKLSEDLAELKDFVASKLSIIKQSLEKKIKYDELQIKKATGEVRKLKQRITGMKKEVVRVQSRAEFLELEVLLDPLTGAHNRRAYQKCIQEKLVRFNQHNEIFSVLMLDIDHFKSVNDIYGHWAGDRCLKELVKLTGKMLRGTDFLARYGGEEFILILPGTDEAGIGNVAERMRRHIEKARFIFQDQEIPITVSIGGTTPTHSDQNIEEIFNRVDRALYEAKRSGRNNTVIF